MKPGNHRKCTRCHQALPEELFRNPRTGRMTAGCQDCLAVAREQNRVIRQRIGPEGIRAANLWVKYRITLEQYDALRKAQLYRCAICGVHEQDVTHVATGRPRLDGTPNAAPFRLAVDHCHRSSRVRGLLCPPCNAMIGHAHDRPATLRAAATYLEATATEEQ